MALHTMRSMIEVDPEAARTELTEAFVKAKCHYQDAADIIGCRAPTFTRWARLLGIKEKLEKLEQKAEKEGWHHGRKGGAQFHKDPELKAERTRETRIANGTMKPAVTPSKRAASRKRRREARK